MSKITVNNGRGDTWGAETSLILGSLAVNKHGTDDEWCEWDGWNVTHIPTGLGVIIGIRLEESAKAACYWLAAEADWSFSTVEEMGEKRQHYHALAKKAMEVWKDVGRPEPRPEAFDRLDRDLGFVIGRDEDGWLVWVAEGDEYVERIVGYNYVDDSMTTDGCCYWQASDYVHELQIGDCFFYRGMPMGEMEVDPVPLNISEEEAEEWRQACLTDLSFCDRCELYFDCNDYDAGALVDECSVMCANCIKEAQSRHEICCHLNNIEHEDCNACIDEGCCGFDTEQIPEEELTEDPQESSAIGYPKEGDITLDFSMSREEFKAELETKLFDHMDRQYQHEVLSRRINDTLERLT